MYRSLMDKIVVWNTPPNVPDKEDKWDLIPEFMRVYIKYFMSFGRIVVLLNNKLILTTTLLILV